MLNKIIMIINFVINFALATTFLIEMIRTLKNKIKIPFAVNLIAFIHFVISAIYAIR